MRLSLFTLLSLLTMLLMSGCNPRPDTYVDFTAAVGDNQTYQLYYAEREFLGERSDDPQLKDRAHGVVTYTLTQQTADTLVFEVSPQLFQARLQSTYQAINTLDNEGFGKDLGDYFLAGFTLTLSKHTGKVLEFVARGPMPDHPDLTDSGRNQLAINIAFGHKILSAVPLLNHSDANIDKAARSSHYRPSSARVVAYTDDYLVVSQQRPTGSRIYYHYGEWRVNRTNGWIQASANINLEELAMGQRKISTQITAPIDGPSIYPGFFPDQALESQFLDSEPVPGDDATEMSSLSFDQLPHTKGVWGSNPYSQRGSLQFVHGFASRPLVGRLTLTDVTPLDENLQPLPLETIALPANANRFYGGIIRSDTDLLTLSRTSEDTSQSVAGYRAKATFIPGSVTSHSIDFDDLLGDTEKIEDTQVKLDEVYGKYIVTIQQTENQELQLLQTGLKGKYFALPSPPEGIPNWLPFWEGGLIAGVRTTSFAGLRYQIEFDELPKQLHFAHIALDSGQQVSGSSRQLTFMLNRNYKYEPKLPPIKRERRFYSQYGRLIPHQAEHQATSVAKIHPYVDFDYLAMDMSTPLASICTPQIDGKPEQTIERVYGNYYAQGSIYYELPIADMPDKEFIIVVHCQGELSSKRYPVPDTDTPWLVDVSAWIKPELLDKAYNEFTDRMEFLDAAGEPLQIRGVKPTCNRPLTLRELLVQSKYISVYGDADEVVLFQPTGEPVTRKFAIDPTR